MLKSGDESVSCKVVTPPPTHSDGLWWVRLDNTDKTGGGGDGWPYATHEHTYSIFQWHFSKFGLFIYSKKISKYHKVVVVNP